MKNIFKFKLFLSLIILTALFSCRTEETEFIETPQEDTLTSTSVVASLMQKTSANDGSIDNIIDKSNCFNIKFPVEVTVNGMVINVSSLNDYKVIEYLFDDDDDDMDTLDITYPITIILDDHSEVLINSDAQLNSYSINCNGENEYDFDIECLDFNYPITTFLYNSNNEIIDSFNINSDRGLYNFIDDLNASDIVSIKFPINVTLFDNTEISITNLLELQNIIKLYENDCDEDDDYDYNDDDCDDCTIDELTSYLTNCPGWTVDKLERYGNDYDNAYDGYIFNFLSDGTISVYYSGGTDYGTWTASGTGNNITVTINVPDLPYCNNNWILHEISKYNESKIDFRVGNDDRMRYENTCN